MRRASSDTMEGRQPHGSAELEDQQASNNRTKRASAIRTTPEGFITQLIYRFAPELRFHPQESYFPCSTEWYLQRCSLWVSRPTEGDNMLLAKVGCSSEEMEKLIAQRDTQGGILYSAGKHANVEVASGKQLFWKGSPFYLLREDKQYPDAAAGQASALNTGEVPIYVHVLKHNDEIDLQYFIFFPHKQMTSGSVLKKAGKSQGHWEHVTVRVCANTATIIAIYTSGRWEEGKWYIYFAEPTNKIPGFSVTADGHPIIYCGKHHHALKPTMENTSKGFFGLSSAKDEDVSDEGTHWQTWKKVVRLPSLAKDASGELAWLRFSGGWSKFSDKSLALSADMKACRGPTLQFCYTQRDEPLTKSNTIPSDHNNDHSNCGLDSEAIRQVRLNSVLHNFHSGDHWQTVQQNASMNLKELSVVAYNDVWAVDFANKVWYWNGKLWEQEQDCLLSTISAGCDGTVWGVFNGTLLKRSTRKTSKSEESTWVEVRTRLFQPKQVAVGARHFVLVLDTDGKVWQWKDDVEQQDIGSSSSQAGSWERLICRPLDWLEKKNPLVEEHEEKWNILFSSLAAGAGETLWALDLSGCVWVQHGRSSSKLWERIEGEPKGSVFSSGVDDGNEGEEEQEESNDKKRAPVPTRLAMISVGDQANIYGLRYSSETNRSAVRWNGYRFEELGEEFGWISVSSNGEVWALSYDDNEGEGLEEAKEEKEEAEVEAPPSSTKYSKSQVYKCVRHGLDVVCCSTFEKLWDDGNTGSIRDVAFFRPIPPEGYYFLGDYAERTHLNLPKRACTLVVREQNLNDSDDEENVGEPHKRVPLLAKPVTYERLWDTRDTGTTYGGRTGMTVWRPIPPEGYVALGDVVTPGQALEMPPPYLHYYRCVHLGLLQRGTFKKQSDIGWLWCDKNSGGSYGRCSVWTVDSRDIHSAAPPGTFIYLRDYYNSPPDSLAYCLAYATPL